MDPGEIDTNFDDAGTVQVRGRVRPVGQATQYIPRQSNGAVQTRIRLAFKAVAADATADQGTSVELGTGNSDLSGLALLPMSN